MLLTEDSLDWADVKLSKGENRRKYSVGMCVAKHASRYARHKGEKGDDFPDVQPSECHVAR